MENKRHDQETNHLEYRPDIDGLRAFSALAVVLYHASPHHLIGGFTGVDVFFVISGFLISTIIFRGLYNHTFSFLDFFSKRVKRIFPALLLVIVFSFVFGWFALLPDEFKQLGKHILGAAGFVSNFVLWFDVGYFDISAELKPLLHLWSLAIEEQFYLLWPLILWFAYKKKWRIGYIVLITGIVSFALNLYFISIQPSATFYLPVTRFWEILFGSMLAWLVFTKDQAKLPTLNIPIQVWLNFSSLLGSALLVYSVTQVESNHTFPGSKALIPVLGAVLIILSGPNALVNRFILSNRVMVWFGLISYPLYLWHWPFLSFARIIEGQVPDRKIRILAVLASILLAWLTYKFVETPLRKSKKSKTITGALLSFMVVIGAIGYLTFSVDGFSTRRSMKTFLDNQNELILQTNRNEECIKYADVNDPLFSFCKFASENSDETVAVIGDSHARSAYDGMVHILKDYKINTVLLANSGCPPLLDAPVIGVKFNAADREICNQRTKQLLDVLVKRKDIKKVFFFTRGTIYFTGDEPVTGDKKVCDQITVQEFKRGAQKTIDLLVTNGKQVFWVTEPPELHLDPRSCLVRPFRSNQLNCSLNVEVVQKRQDQYMDLLYSLKDITLVSLMPAMCPGNKCIVFDSNNTLLYYDDDHLSVSGSKFVADRVFRKYFE